MDCIECGSAMSTGAKFCPGCGAAVTRACASCGHELASGARFCEQCGTPADPGGATVVSGPPATADGAARKTVTVLFADLVGSTSFGERVDAESVRETLAGYHALARRVIDDHDGVLAKFIGDGVMALFGVPETSEDDAVRAVATGVALQSEFASIAGRVEEQFGVRLGLRVGINTGEVVIGADDDDLVGDAVNTASRIESACPPGEVLVGDGTWRLARAAVEFAELGDVSVKGKAEPIATYQVMAATRRNEDVPTPFVGRATELSRIRSAFDDVVSGRIARLASIIGSPGVGKTRLAREFAASVADVAGVVEMRCRQSGTATFAPIAELLRSTATIAADEAPEAITARIRRLVGHLHDADRVAGLLTSFLDDGAVRSTEEAFFAVRRLTEAMANERPVVVVVDDIQWAEPLFLDLLEHLAEWVDDAGVLIITSARPEIREVRPSFSAESRTLKAVVQLDGLDAHETAELASRLVGSGSLPPDLIERLPTSTEGNPLFVRELMKTLVDDGVIVEVDGAWTLTVDAEAVEVPPTIQSLLAARLDRLPPDERRLLELASVVGSEFPLGAVQSIAPEGTIDPGDLRAAMDRLRRRELVDPTGRYWGDDAVYRFHHALIRDAAYRRLLKRRRADLHVQVGEWTERTADRLPGEYDASIGFHHERAYGYLRELSADEAEARPVGRTAARLFGVAAQRSLDRDDVAAAGVLAERAIACLDPGDPAMADLLLIGCEALLAIGEVARGSELVRRLGELDGDVRLRGWAESLDAQLAVMTEPERLQDVAQRLDTTAEQLAGLGDESGVAKARLVRAQALARMGRIGECESELDVALTAARAADDRRRVAAVLGAAPVAALWGPSPIPRAGGRCLDVIRLLRITGGSPAVEATSTRCQAVLEALRGRFDTARSMLAEARSTVEELGLNRGVLETEFYAGIVELLAGDPDAAEPRLRTAFEGLDRLGLGADAGHVAAYLARALLRLGRVDEAGQVARTAERQAGRNPQTGILARAVRAEVLARAGDRDEAVELARAAVEMAAATDLVVDHADASAVLAVVAEAVGDDPTAVRARRDAVALAERKGAVPAAPTVGDTTVERDAPTPPRPPYPPGGGCVVVDRTAAESDGEVELPTAMDRRVLGTWQGRVSLVELRAEDGFRRFAVEEYDPAGEATSVTLFAATTAAIQQASNFADQRFATTTDVAPSYDVILRFTNAIQHRDPDSFRAITEPSFVMVDHRDFGWPLLNRDEMTDLYRDVTPPGEPFFAGDLVEVDTHGIVIRGVQYLVTADHDLDESSPACIVVVANDHRVERMEWFAETEVDRALARFHERTADRSPTPPGPTNLSTRAGDRFVEIFNARGDLRTVGFAPDYRRIDRRGVVSAPDAHAEEMVTATEANYADDPVMTIEHLAIRGELHSLHRSTIAARGREIPRLDVGAVDPNGRLALDVGFDTDAFDEAIAELDRQWFTSLTAVEQQSVRVGARYGRAASTWDLALFEELTTDDFAYFDGTPLGTGWLERQQYLESQRLQGELLGPQQRHVFDIVELPRPDVMLSRVISVGTGQQWQGDWERRHIIVLQILGDRVYRFGLFPYDDLDPARRWARELDAPDQLEEPLDNLARQVARRMLVAMNDGTLPEREAEFFEPNWQRADHRSIIGTGVIDESTHNDLVRALHTQATSTPVATRGDLFSLSRGSTRYDGGYESTYLVMSEVSPAGRQVRVDMFDEDALDDALEALDGRWRAGLSDREERNLATLDDWSRTYDEDDTAALESLLGPGFWFDDRQQLGAGILDLDGLVDFHRRSGEVHGRSQRRRHAVQFLAPDLALVNSSVSGLIAETGLDWTKTLWLVAEVSDGRVHHTAGFDGDQRAAAHEYATAIASARRLDEARWNRAGRVTDRLVRRLGAGLAMSPDMLADDFAWSMMRADDEAVERDADAFVIDADGRYQPGTDIQVRPIAIRDENMMVAHEFEGAAADPTRLTLIVVDERDRLVRVDHFDPDAFDPAMAALHHAWWATLSAEEQATIRVAGDFGRVFREHDPESLERVLAPDFAAVELGEFGLGEMDREQYLASHRGRNDLFGPTRQHYDVVALPAPDVMIIRSAVVTAPGGAGWENVVWNVLHVRDDRLARLEVHSEIDPDDARPREWAYRRALEIIGSKAEDDSSR